MKRLILTTILLLLSAHGAARDSVAHLINLTTRQQLPSLSAADWVAYTRLLEVEEMLNKIEEHFDKAHPFESIIFIRRTVQKKLETTLRLADSRLWFLLVKQPRAVKEAYDYYQEVFQNLLNEPEYVMRQIDCHRDYSHEFNDATNMQDALGALVLRIKSFHSFWRATLIITQLLDGHLASTHLLSPENAFDSQKSAWLETLSTRRLQ